MNDLGQRRTSESEDLENGTSVRPATRREDEELVTRNSGEDGGDHNNTRTILRPSNDHDQQINDIDLWNIFDLPPNNILVPPHIVSIVESDNAEPIAEVYSVGFPVAVPSNNQEDSNRCESIVKRYFKRVTIVCSSMIIITLVLFSTLKLMKKTKIVEITMSPSSLSSLSPSKSLYHSSLLASVSIYPSYHPSACSVPSYQPTYPLTWDQLGNDIIGFTDQELIGTSVALTNNHLLIGGCGILRFYGYQNNGSWSLENDLSAYIDDGYKNNLNFVISTSLDGKHILLGLEQYGSGTPGAAMVFREDDSGWVQIGMFVGEEEREYFGTYTAMSGDGTIIAVSNNLGAVKVFRWSNGEYVLGNRFNVDLTTEKKDSAPLSMATDGSVLVVGYGLGKVVYLYNLSSYSLLQTIKSNMLGFGSAVLISEDKSCLAISAFTSAYGRVEIFRFDSVVLYQKSEIIVIPTRPGFSFCFSLCCKCKRLVVGVPDVTENGRVYIYTFRHYGWVLVGRIDGEAIYGKFGASVALSKEGGSMAVGSPSNDRAGSSAGLVQVFTFTGALL